MWTSEGIPLHQCFTYGGAVEDKRVSLSGASETRPKDTGGTSTVEITAKVTDGGQPKVGVTVGFGVGVQDRSGGHDHGNLSAKERPKGKLSLTSGVTNANGEIKLKFFAPEPAGLHTIVADCTASGCASTASHVITVKVPDLVHIPPSYDSPPLYIEIGNIADASNGYRPFNHQQTHFLTPDSIKALDDLVDTFSELGWGQMGINDASLEWGGMFDIAGKWLDPSLGASGKLSTGGHAEHRDGQQVDISFVRPAAVSEKLRKKVYDQVCDGDGVDLPPAILWHATDGYAPHFHIYLTGKRVNGAKSACAKK